MGLWSAAWRCGVVSLPRFSGRLFFGDTGRRRGVWMPAPHPPEFRRRAVELARERPPVAQIAKDLGISESCLRSWMASADIDEGRSEGLTSESGRSWWRCGARSGCWRPRTRSCAGRRRSSPGRSAQNSVPAGPGACRRRDSCRGGLPGAGRLASGFYEWRGQPVRRHRADEQLIDGDHRDPRRCRGAATGHRGCMLSCGWARACGAAGNGWRG